MQKQLAPKAQGQTPSGLVGAALRHFNTHYMFPRRYAFLTELLAPFLLDSETILDVGSSNGKLITQIASSLANPQISGVDVHVQHDAVIPILAYDGTTLPFPDGSFDSVVLIDVLHHADAPAQLLAEAARVSRKNVLVKDHYYRTRLDWQVLKWADFGGNAPHGISLPFHYFTLAEWHDAIQSAKLTILTERPFTRYSYDPCKHIIYHLQKSASEGGATV